MANSPCEKSKEVLFVMWLQRDDNARQSKLTSLSCSCLSGSLSTAQIEGTMNLIVLRINELFVSTRIDATYDTTQQFIDTAKTLSQYLQSDRFKASKQAPILCPVYRAA